MGKMENDLLMSNNIMFKPHTTFVQYYLIALITIKEKVPLLIQNWILSDSLFYI